MTCKGQGLLSERITQPLNPEKPDRERVYTEMNITKYGITENCGYGFYLYNNIEYAYNINFVTNIKVTAKSTTATITESYIDGVPDRERPLTVYVAFDEETGTWFEYFTGLQLSVLGMTRNVVDYFYNDEYNVDNPPFPYSEELLISPPKIYEIHEFAEKISGYTDEWIREYVRLLKSMRERAKKWKQLVDITVQNVINERAKKEAIAGDVESKITSGFGKYSALLNDEQSF